MSSKTAVVWRYSGLTRAVWVVLVSLGLMWTTGQADSAALSLGYKSETTLNAGTLVSLTDKDQNQIAPATVDNADNLLGAVIEPKEALINSVSSSDNVQVATTGLSNVIVSNINGEIRAGDKITPSPLAGVGMKATSNTKVVGVAQASFETARGNATEQEVRDKNGQARKVLIAKLPVHIGVSYHVEQSGEVANVLPPVIHNLATTIAGKEVGTSRIVTSLLIFILSLITISIVLYSSVKSSLVAIGRNPLSETAVYRSLLQVFALASGILGASLLSIYWILSR